MSGRLEDMQRQIQAEIHRQVEERVHAFFSASSEDLHVALAAIFRLYQDERKRAKNALRRAEEAEAIANLAMAEGLRAAEGYRMLLEASYDKGLDLTRSEIRAQRRADEAEQKTAKLRALLDEAIKLFPSLGEMFAKELAEIGGENE